MYSAHVRFQRVCTFNSIGSMYVYTEHVCVKGVCTYIGSMYVYREYVRVYGACTCIGSMYVYREYVRV